MNSQRTYYRRNLPHYQPPYATYHIVFRLDGSLPRHMIEELRNGREKEKEMIASIKDEKRKRDEWRAHHQAYFEKFDALMDGNTAGPRWLADDRVAEIVAEAIHFRDAREYDLLVHTIMPNHVHMVCTVGRSGTPSPEEENRAVGRNAIPPYRILQSSSVTRRGKQTHSFLDWDRSGRKKATTTSSATVRDSNAQYGMVSSIP